MTSVAIERAVNKEGLREVDYDVENALIKHSQEVYVFYGSNVSREQSSNWSCCKSTHMTTTYPILASVAPHHHEADESDIYQTTPYCDNNPQILIEFPFDIDCSVVNLQISEGSDVP